MDGEREYYRCPSHVFRGKAELREFLQAYAAFDAHGTLPCAGGLNDQAWHFMEACAEMSAERSSIEALLREHRRVKRQSNG